MSAVDSIAAWIAQYLRDSTPHAQSMIVTLFGDSVLPYRKQIWTGHLITLLAPFGINERLVRTSLYRLSEAGWVTAERRGRRSYYGTAPAGRRRFRDAYKHVYKPMPAWRRGWVVVISAKGIRAADRSMLRRELEWDGFAAVETGVFVCPTDSPRSAQNTISRLGLTTQVAIFDARASNADHEGLGRLVRASWALQPANDAYTDFMQRFEPVLPHLRRDPVTPEQAFVSQSLMIDAFRRATLKDPRLPTALLAESWPGRQARELCREVYTGLYRLTSQHLKSILGIDRAKCTPDTVTRRFGGLP